MKLISMKQAEQFQDRNLKNKSSEIELSSISALADFLLHSGPRDIHFIGVAGSGMSGLAGLLLALGHRVSGPDVMRRIQPCFA